MIMPARFGARVLREIPLWPQVLARRGNGPRIAFLPSSGREQSSLLRVYNMAGALGGLGWSTLLLPARLTLGQRRRLLAVFRPDVVFMQGSRHELNRPSLYPGRRIVYDMDDADFHLDRLAGPVCEAMPRVAAVVAGSRYVADWCRAAGAPAVEVVWTGTPVSERPRPPQEARPPLVAWAQAAPESYRLERAWVERVMTGLAGRRPEVRLRLYGRKPGQGGAILDPFRSAGIAVEWLGNMPYGDYLASFDDVAVGLSPVCPDTPFSRGKSFGKVLAYLDRKVPVIASDEADHALFFTPETGVITNDPEAWIAALDRLLGDAGVRQSMADAAFEAFRARLSVEAAAARLDRVLRAVVGQE